MRVHLNYGEVSVFSINLHNAILDPFHPDTFVKIYDQYNKFTKLNKLLAFFEKLNYSMSKFFS